MAVGFLLAALALFLVLVTVVVGIAWAELVLWAEFDRGPGVRVSMRSWLAALWVALEIVFVEWPLKVLRR